MGTFRLPKLWRFGANNNLKYLKCGAFPCERKKLTEIFLCFIEQRKATKKTLEIYQFFSLSRAFYLNEDINFLMFEKLTFSVSPESDT